MAIIDTSTFLFGEPTDIRMIIGAFYDLVENKTGRPPSRDVAYYNARSKWSEEQGCVVNGSTVMWQSNEHRVEFILKWT
jgi:hypothetical protein